MWKSHHVVAHNDWAPSVSVTCQRHPTYILLVTHAAQQETMSGSLIMSYSVTFSEFPLCQEMACKMVRWRQPRSLGWEWRFHGKRGAAVGTLRPTHPTCRPSLTRL